MTKYEWESELKKNIHRLPDDEIKRVLEYYGELFADKIEQGYGEIEIISQFGNPVDVADKILGSYEGELRPSETNKTPDLNSPTQSEKPTPSPQPAPPQPAPQSNNAGGTAREQDEYNCRYHKNNKLQRAQNREKPRVGRNDALQSCGSQYGFKADRFILFIVLNVITGFAFFIVVGAVWIVAISFTVAGGATAIGGAAGALLSIVHLFAGGGAAGFAEIGVCAALCGVGILLLVGFITLVKLMAKGTVALFKSIIGWINPSQPKKTSQEGVAV